MRASARRSRIDSRARSSRPLCSERRPPCAVFWMVERGRAAEIGGVDQRGAEAAARWPRRRWSARRCRRRSPARRTVRRSKRVRSRGRIRTEVSFYSRGRVCPGCRPSPTSATTGIITFTISTSPRHPAAHRRSSPISISTISRSCTTSCGWSTSPATAASACWTWAAARAPIWSRFAQGGAIVSGVDLRPRRSPWRGRTSSSAG